MRQLILWEIQDSLSKNPEFISRLSIVDHTLSQRDLIDRIRHMDHGMVMQLFYVRNQIIANPVLPRQLRLSALDQLQATIEGLPDFILHYDDPYDRESYGQKTKVKQPRYEKGHFRERWDRITFDPIVPV